MFHFQVDPERMSRVIQDLKRGPHHTRQGIDGDCAMLRDLARVKGKKPNVCVVGAGFAGLRCADVLLRAGADVTILEARNRLGGRVHQVESGGHLMDMGPNWIHGIVGNPISAIAQKTGTVVHNLGEESALIDSDGKRVNATKAHEMSETIWALIVDAFKYSDEQHSRIDPSKSLLDYLSDRLQEANMSKKQMEEHLKFAHMWGAFIGGTIENQSLKFFFLEETLDGDNAFVASTYQRVLKHVIEVVIGKAKVFCKQAVTALRLIESADKSESPKVEVSGLHGYSSIFNEVVVTAPLGWLKSNHGTAFASNPLPARLSAAISGMGYGNLEKVYVTFPSAYWMNEMNVVTNSGQGSLPSSDTINHPYPESTHFLQPSYISGLPADVPWNHELIVLSSLPNETAHPTLLFYISGPCAAQYVSSLKDASPNSDKYNAILTSCLQPFYSRLPNYDAESPECIPTAFLATQWQNDPYAGNGSYTNWPCGTLSGDKDVEALREGWPEKGIWFAGEHTAPFVALGTTTGAYWAGEGVARRIANLYGLEVEEDEEAGKDGAAKELSTDDERRDAAQLNGIAL